MKWRKRIIWRKDNFLTLLRVINIKFFFFEMLTLYKNLYDVFIIQTEYDFKTYPQNLLP